MPSLRVIKRRITSVRNTQQITKAMKMVAAAKLRRAQERVLMARPYACTLAEVVERVVRRADPRHHPLLAAPSGEACTLLVFTSDKGLCGAFNSNVLRRGQEVIREVTAAGQTLSLTLIGKKGRDFFRRRGYTADQVYLNLGAPPTWGQAQEICGPPIAAYLRGESSGITAVYTEFKSALRQRVVVRQLLPAVPVGETGAAEEGLEIDFLYEPSATEVLEGLLGRYLTSQLLLMLLESAASEHGARMAAMDNATTNASDMIGRLTLTYNRTRQAAITKELIEVVSGADALKG